MTISGNFVAAAPMRNKLVATNAMTVLFPMAVLALALITASCGSGSTSITPAGTTPGRGTLLWNGDFSTGDLSQYSPPYACPGAIKVVPIPAPLGNNKYAASFTVTDQSNQNFCPLTYSPHNRADMRSNPQNLFYDGDDKYIAWSSYFPSGFPSISSWFVAGSIYGKPYGGTGGEELDVQGNNLGLHRGAAYNYDEPWSTPITPNQWMNITFHVKFSPDPSVGFVELWYNGVPQKFKNGSTRIHYSTLIQGVNWTGPGGSNFVDMNQYRCSCVSLGTITIYHAAAKVGTTYASVQP